MESCRIFICGLGRRAKSHIAAIQKQDSIKIVGAYDLAPLARMNATKELTQPIYAHLKKGIAETNPDCILVCTPPSVRLSLIRELSAFSTIKTIIVEKPLALSFNEAQKMYDLCESASISLFVVHQLRFANEFKALKATVESGRLGKIDLIHAACYGNLFDQGSHLMDLLQWMMIGNEELSWMEATSCNDLPLLGRAKPFAADFVKDTAHPGAIWSSIKMKFANGIEAILDCGVLETMPEPELGPWLQKRMSIMGTRGSARAHVASHFTEISEDERRTFTSGIYEYEACLNEYYRAFITSRQEKTIFQQKEENLRVIKWMDVAHQSGISQQLIPMSEPYNEEKTEVIIANNAPLVSVIMPMEDHRGWGIKSIIHWTEKQDCDPSLFEVIVILDRSTKKLESQLRMHLRPHDQLVYADLSNEMEQYHLGSTLAKSDILFFSEPHCLAEPEAITQTLKFFQTENHDGFCSRTSPIWINAVGEMESKMYDEGFINWRKNSAWEKVIIRGFVLKKAVYFAVGGFNYRYDRFAEWLLAATLRQKGYTFAYAPGVGLEHAYSENFRLLDRFIKEFTDGECLFRLETKEQKFCSQFFGSPPEWNEILMFRPELAKKALIQTFNLLVKQKKLKHLKLKYFFILRKLFYQFFKITFGKNAIILKYQLKVLKAKLLFYFSTKKSPLKYQAFLSYYMNQTSLCRVKYGSTLSKSNAQTCLEKLTYPLAQLDENHLYEFHPREIHNGEEFRWSNIRSAVALFLQNNNYILTIHLQKERAIHYVQEVALFINNHFIRDLNFEKNSLTLSCKIRKEWLKTDTTSWLYIHTLPFLEALRNGDHRILGLPIKEITLTPY